MPSNTAYAKDHGSGVTLARLLAPRLLAVLLALVGILLAVGGGQLLLLGGSFYYLITGLAVVASAIFLWHGSMWGVWIFAARAQTVRGPLTYGVY
ncbi:hypothetical protein [Mesorhizobium sp. A623]